MTRPAQDRLSPFRVLSHLGVMGIAATILGVVVSGLGIPFAVVLGMGAENVAATMEDLPQELKTEDLAQRSEIVDSQGNVIATLYDENRINVPLRQINRIMVKAIVAIEDYRFYEHGALDLKGTLRALITNKATGSQVQGGSSITQQLVKLTLLSQAKGKQERLEAIDDTYARKIRELRYAIAIEQEYSKDWILERYLNTAYFGDGAYGIQSAARHFFDKDAKDLNLRQSAMLAGLVKNPTGYDPTNYEDRAIDRRNVVLDRMAQLNVISTEQAEAAKAKGTGLNVQETDNGCLDSRAPFFCDYVVRYLKKDKSLGETTAERKELIYSGGLTIRTTIDMDYQQAAQNSVDNRVNPTDAAVGGLAMVTPGTGAVLALAQSRPMGFNRKQGETFLNYTVPKEMGGAKGFQPGSTFKTFVLASALNSGIPLDYAIEAPEQISIDESEFTNCGGKPYGPTSVSWEPSNATTSGSAPQTLITGSRLSVNTFYAQLEATTGLCEPYRLAKKLGVQLTQPKADKDGFGAERTPSFTLGTPDASPLEMAEAYATFAAHGLHCDSRPVTAIEDADGNLVKEYRPRCKQVIDAGAADAVSAVLRGVQEPGGFGYTYDLDLAVPSAGKTGTTQDQKAVWFIGYTPQVATASMIAGANSEGEPITLQFQTVGGEFIDTASGSKIAGPMWRDAMRAIGNTLTYEDFPTPDLSGIEPHPYTTVPSVTGMSVASAKAVLRAAGLKAAVAIHVTGAYSATENVAQSKPSSGSSVLAGGVVMLVPSSNAPAPPKPPRGGGGGRGGNGGGGGNGGRGDDGRGGGRD